MVSQHLKIMSTPNQTLEDDVSTSKIGASSPITKEQFPDTTETVKSSIVPPIPTRTYGNQGLFSIQTSVIINASVDAVFNATTNVSNFPEWNTFVPKVDILSTNRESPSYEIGRLKIGTEMIFHVCMKGKDTPTQKSAELVTVMEGLSDRHGRRGHRAAWRSKQMGLKAERVTEVIEIRAGNLSVPKSAKTEYRTWQTFGGPLAYILKLMIKDDLMNRFADWARDLKNYCEKMEELRGSVDR